MRTSTRSKITVVAGILGLAALFGSAAATAASGVLADMPSPAHVAAMAPQGMPDPGMPQGAQPNEMPEP